MSEQQATSVPVADEALPMIEAMETEGSDEDDDVHHYLTLLLNDKLFLAPIQEDAEGLTVLDVGTGTGIWCIDFGYEHPQAEVVGTDLSPIQPAWVPTNVRFEIEDAALDWTFRDNTFDFIHMRYLIGGIDDWGALFKQAYRCCKAGGWVESFEVGPIFHSDDGSIDKNPVIAVWNRMFTEAGVKIGKSFSIPTEDLQRPSMEEGGFTDCKVVDLKIPMGGWARDPRLAEIGRTSLAALETDLEGFTLLLWHNVVQWPQDEYKPFLDALRKTLRDKKTHAYLKARLVYGQKPEAA
ncbi:Demethylmenaquinone methyltransferase [Madurella mycetomatis]|uniref:Demethylmenaquinone methyltransferase n=1 Tax=Madurella mycetomatis TaxID=100816 RepID=A0A175WFC5_9PEZI|nr:Demethylmenaquinone methyltransferase [Madurella mycetomatis]